MDSWFSVPKYAQRSMDTEGGGQMRINLKIAGTFAGVLVVVTVIVGILVMM